MKGHLLNDGDRAALQALVPLASTLGIGTIFALFFAGRRKPGIAIFELFTIVAVLTAAGSTAFFSISLLHQNQAITSHELTQTAMPLVVAAFLLVFVSVFSRLPESGPRLAALVPLALVGAAIAALLASTTWSAEPESASLAALIILGVGVVLGVTAWAVERLDIGWDRRSERRRLTGLYASGYQPEERSLLLALPVGGDSRPERIACWTRKGRLFLDLSTGWYLRSLTHRLWREQALGEARSPAGPTILVRMQVRVRLPLLRNRARFAFHLVEPASGGDLRSVEVSANDNGVFDVTELDVI